MTPVRFRALGVALQDTLRAAGFDPARWVRQDGDWIEVTEDPPLRPALFTLWGAEGRVLGHARGWLCLRLLLDDTYELATATDHDDAS